MDFLQILAAAAILGAIYYVGSSVHYLFFHPLAKYPGPFLSRFSVLPSWYHTLKGNRHIWIWRCHQVYGPLFRYSPDGVLFNTSTAAQAIYGTKANVMKGPVYKIWPQEGGTVNTWTCRDRVKHARKRRILNAAFSDQALKLSEPYIIQHTDRWCELLFEESTRGWSGPKNMAHLADYLVFDILGELCYAKSFNIKEPGENELKSLPTLIGEFLKLLFVIMHAPFADLWFWLKPKGLDKLMNVAAPKGIRIYTAFINSCLIQRIKEEQELQHEQEDSNMVRKDMFHHIFRAKDPDNGNVGYTRAELFEETNLLVLAGSDTTSVNIAALSFYLTRYPKVYAKLIEEIRKTFTTAEEIHAGPKLTACHYLRACIDESLRMNSPVAAEMQREVLLGGIVIDSHPFQQGTKVGISSYSLHYNEDPFPDPFTFKPERWILDEKAGITPDALARAEAAFVPFSIGPRGCPGKSLAYLEMGIVMAKCLYWFDVRAVEGDELGAGSKDLMYGRRHEKQFQCLDYGVLCRDGPMVQFKSRAA